MTAEYVAEHLAELSDAELIDAARTARDDLAAAANDQPNSERHEACFAGALIYAGELQARGLSLVTKH